MINAMNGDDNESCNDNMMRQSAVLLSFTKMLFAKDVYSVLLMIFDVTSQGNDSFLF